MEYKLFSRRWFKEFNKQSYKDKKLILEAILMNKVSQALSTAYSDAMATGIYFRADGLYEKYVQYLDKLDSHSEEWSNIVAKMLSEIRVDHVRYRQMQAQKEAIVFKKSTEVGNNAD